MFATFDTIHECDRHTASRRTPHDDIRVGRIYAQHRAAKTSCCQGRSETIFVAASFIVALNYVVARLTAIGGVRLSVRLSITR